MRSTQPLVPGSNSSKLLASAGWYQSVGRSIAGARPGAFFSVWFFFLALCRTRVLALLLGITELVVRCFELVPDISCVRGGRFIEISSNRLVVPGSDISKFLAAARLESVCGSLNRGTRPVPQLSWPCCLGFRSWPCAALWAVSRLCPPALGCRRWRRWGCCVMFGFWTPVGCWNIWRDFVVKADTRK